MADSHLTPKPEPELDLLHRAFAEPVAQFTLVDFVEMEYLMEVQAQLLAVYPNRPGIWTGFDASKTSAEHMFSTVRSALDDQRRARGGSWGQGEVPVVWLVDEDDHSREASQSRTEFWRQLNFQREAWTALGTQLFLTVTPTSHRLARNYAADFLDWCSLRVHLRRPVSEPGKNPLIRPSPLAYPNLQLTPAAAIRVFQRNHPSRQDRLGGLPAEERLPFLEAVMTLGFQSLAALSRGAEQPLAGMAERDLPRWHELNYVLETGAADSGAAALHGEHLLKMAREHPNARLRRRALDALVNLTDLATGLEPLRDAVPLFEEHQHALDPMISTAATRWSRFGIAAELIRLNCGTPTPAEELVFSFSVPQRAGTKSSWPDWPTLCRIALMQAWQAMDALNRRTEPHIFWPQFEPYGPVDRLALRAAHFCFRLDVGTREAAEALEHYGWLINAAETILGPGHPELGIILHHFALVYDMANRRDESLRASTQAITILKDRLGPHHPTTVKVLDYWPEAAKIAQEAK